MLKYMGSKRRMLENGLGKLLDVEAPKSLRFIDLFSGSGSVGCYVAENHSIPVLAYDLQNYSVILSNAVISRVEPIDADALWKSWSTSALSRLANQDILDCDPPRRTHDDPDAVHLARRRGALRLRPALCAGP